MIFAIKFILFLNAAFLILMSLRGILAMRAEALAQKATPKVTGPR